MIKKILTWLEEPEVFETRLGFFIFITVLGFLMELIKYVL